MKKVWKSTFIGLGISFGIFCIIGVVFDLTGHGDFHMTGYSFTKMVIGCLATGMGWGLPTAIYRKEDLPKGVQCLVHIGTGLVIQTITAFLVGWVPVEAGAGKCVLIVLWEIASALLIWVGFYRYNVALARRMNRRIQEKR